jgi:hypothetical protein
MNCCVPVVLGACNLRSLPPKNSTVMNWTGIVRPFASGMIKEKVASASYQNNGDILIYII